MYVFKTKLCSLSATFFNTQQTLQRCLNVAIRVIWRRDVGQCQINIETTLKISTLRFTTLNNVESTFCVSTLILTTLENVATMLLFSTASFTTLINVETTLWIWPYSKSRKEQKNIFELQKKGTYLINNTCFWLWSIKKKTETWNVQCKNKRWKIKCTVHEKNMKITASVCWWQNKLMYGIALLVHIYTLLPFYDLIS